MSDSRLKNILGGSLAANRTSLAVGFFSCLLLALAWMWQSRPLTSFQWVIALLLALSVVLADTYPIHIRYATKLSLISVPLYLATVLLPRPLAIITVGAGILAADGFNRASRGLKPYDFIQDPARWMMITFASSTIAQQAEQPGLYLDFLLVAAASAMYLLDVITFSWFTSFTTHESFWGLVRENFSQTFDVETIQYLIGILGALAFTWSAWTVLLLIIPTMITYVTYKNAKEMNRSTRELLVTMADAVDLRDAYTGGHSRRVAELVARILKQMNIQGTEAELIFTAARLHDIGKIGIPDAILLKPGPLSDTEWDEMRSHPGKGAELLRRYTDFARGYEMVLHHHEHWDGIGYPSGLKGTAIPFGARVIAAADAFDAMTTDRPYRGGMTPWEAAQVMIEGSGVQWDKEIVDALLEAVRDELATPALISEVTLVE